MKYLCVLFSFISLFCGGYMRFESLADAFNSSSKMIVSFDGVDFSFEKGSDKYEVVMTAINQTIKDSHEMPAYCVSLDEETRKERKTGVWVELIYDSHSKHEGMDFESLLFKVEEDDYAISFIRKYNGKYEGRCFHLSLAGSTKALFDAVMALSESSIANK